MPVTKSTGDLVFGSTVNQLGSFIMLAQGVGQDTALNQVVRLVQVRVAIYSRLENKQIICHLAACFW